MRDTAATLYHPVNRAVWCLKGQSPQLKKSLAVMTSKDKIVGTQTKIFC